MRWVWFAAILTSSIPEIAAAGCPVGTEVVVDNDRPGSGYREAPAANWLDRGTGACLGTYRYLSHTVGDGSRRGRAFWRPSITVAGTYEVETSFRATENRSSDADYVLRGDRGGPQRTSVDQRGEGECRRVRLGTVFCTPGGGCELELDGTDDGQSDAADATTFTLLSCEETPPPPPPPGEGCAGIAANPAYELCREEDNRCAGVFTDGSGCGAYCAAAGMRCVARFGGEPGCMEEPNTSIPCDADNGHQSDWCVCEGEAPPPPPERPDHLVREGDALFWCGAPIRLVGYGHYGMLTESSYDFEAHLDRLVDEAGANFVRVWGQYHWTDDLSPFAGERGDRDLQSPDPAYYARLRALAEAARDRGVILQLTLFDSVQLEGSATGGNRWINSPYRDENNRQAYLQRPEDFNAVPPASAPAVWAEVNQPYIERVVDTLCDLPNVIYEVMNEPEGSGGDPGRGTPAFVDAVVGELDRLLARPQCTGSSLIGTNDDTGRTASDPRVDVVAVHVGPRAAADFAALARPVIVSNDGDDSQVTDRHGFGALTPADRAARIQAYAEATRDARGHLHLEILDKDFHGASWLSADYAPSAQRFDPAVLSAVASAVATPARTCGTAPPPAPDAGIELDAGARADSGAAADAGEAGGRRDAGADGAPDPGAAPGEADGCRCARSAPAGWPALWLAALILGSRPRRRA